MLACSVAQNFARLLTECCMTNHKAWQRGNALAHRWSFTLLLVASLLIMALLTRSHVAALSQVWLQRLGFAPVDLWLARWDGLLTSALVTAGGLMFWQALLFVALTVGAAEWLAGTLAAFLVFWGVHLATLLLESLAIALPLHLMHLSLGTGLFVARDVGPSAGAFGALGLVIGLLPRPWRWIGGGAILAALLAVVLTASGTVDELTLQLTAELAHLIAFPLGWLIAARVDRHRKQPPKEVLG